MTAPRLILVNGMEPAIYRRRASLGQDEPVTSIRIGTDHVQVDVALDHYPTPEEIQAMGQNLAQVDRCPGCGVRIVSWWPKKHTHEVIS
jgi:hypothetical protein